MFNWIKAIYQRLTFKRLSERDEVVLGLHGVHECSAMADLQHRGEIHQDVIMRWPYTQARLIAEGAVK